MDRRNLLVGMVATQFRFAAGFLGLTFLGPDAALASSGGAGIAQCAGLDEGGTAPASRLRRQRIKDGLRRGFGVQYWGDSFTVTDLAAAPHGLLIIETAKAGASETTPEVFFSADEIRQIGRNGARPVLGYLNLAKVEPYRDYWVAATARNGAPLTPEDAPWIGPSLGLDGTLARYWTPQWHKIVEDRVDRLMALHVDGIFLDDVLQYYTFARAVALGAPDFKGTDDPRSGEAFAQAMMELVTVAVRRARQHDCNALIVVNNGVYIGRDAGTGPVADSLPATFDTYRDDIDGILIESLFAQGGDTGAISVLHEDFASEDIPVLAIDFADTETLPGETTDAMKATVAKRAAAEGFAAYVADDALFNRLYAPVPLEQTDPPSP